MRHVKWVIDGVLAGRPGPTCAPWDLAELAAGGIGAVISLDANIDSKAIRAAGLRHLPAYRSMVLLETQEDHLDFLSVMPNVVRFVDACRRMGKAVMVHCHYGRDRTGAVLACYLVAREGYTPKEAYDHIVDLIPKALTAAGYAETILSFDRWRKEHPEWIPPAPG